jgi:hypothetical protein
MKRKATRIIEPGTMPVIYSVSIIKFGGKYIGVLCNIDQDILKQVSSEDFNTLLTRMMNEFRGYYIKETILYNGSQKIAYYAWPPALSFEFIESFYNKKKPAD